MYRPGQFLHLATRGRDDAVLEPEIGDRSKGELPGLRVGPPALSGLFHSAPKLFFFPSHSNLHPILRPRRRIPVHLGDDNLCGLVTLSPVRILSVAYSDQAFAVLDDELLRALLARGGCVGTAKTSST
jgi:hypothetical protein